MAPTTTTQIPPGVFTQDEQEHAREHDGEQEQPYEVEQQFTSPLSQDSLPPDHPLRADPLHSLPDAVAVPRPTTRRRSSTTSSLFQTSTPHRSPRPEPSPSPLHRTPPAPPPDAVAAVLPPSSLPSSTNSTSTPALTDPLRAAVVAAAAPRPQSPPAGRAYATDSTLLSPTTSTSSSSRPWHHHYYHGPSDATSSPSSRAPRAMRPTLRVEVAPMPPAPGCAAGVFTVRLIPLTPDAPLPLPAPVARALADFFWLSDTLSAAHPAVIVPPLPPLALAGRVAHGMSHDAARATGLARFASRAAAHPVLAANPALQAFIGLLGEPAWRKARRAPPPTPTTAVRNPLWRAGRVATRFIAAALDRTRSQSASNPTAAATATSGAALGGGASGEGGTAARGPASGGRLNNGNGSGVAGGGGSHQRDGVQPFDARLQRLVRYVRGLGASLAAVRRAAAQLQRARSERVRAVAALQTELLGLADREGGRFGAALRRARLAGGRGNLGTVSLGTEDGATIYEAGTGGELEIMAAALQSGIGHGGDSAAEAAWRALDEVFRDFEGRAQAAQRIMDTRELEQDRYERAATAYKKARDKLETQTDAMWGYTGGVAGGNDGIGGNQGNAAGGSGGNNGNGASTPTGDGNTGRIFGSGWIRGSSNTSGNAPTGIAAGNVSGTGFDGSINNNRINNYNSTSNNFNGGGGSSPFGGIDKLVEETNVAAAQLAEARRAYEAVATSTTDELRRLRAEMHRDVGGALRKLAVDSARLHTEQAAAWTDLAAVIDAYDAEMSAKRRDSFRALEYTNASGLVLDHTRPPIANVHNIASRGDSGEGVNESAASTAHTNRSDPATVVS